MHEDLHERISQLQAQVRHERGLAGQASADEQADLAALSVLQSSIQQSTQDLEWIKTQNANLITESRMYQLATREFDFPLASTFNNKGGEDGSLVVLELARSCKAVEMHLRAKRLNSVSPTSAAVAAVAKEVEVVLVPHAASSPSDKRTRIPVHANANTTTSSYNDVLRAACEYWGLAEDKYRLEYSSSSSGVLLLVVGTDPVSSSSSSRIKEHHLVLRELPPKPTATTTVAAAPSLPPVSPPPPVSPIAPPPLPHRPTTSSSFLYHAELLITILLATSFAVLSLASNDVERAHSARVQVMRALDEPQFAQVRTTHDMYQWIDAVVVVSSFVPVIGQLRVAPGTNCHSPPSSSSLCYGDFAAPQQPVPFATETVNSAFLFGAFNRTSSNNDACWPAMVSSSAWLPGAYADYYPVRDLDLYSVSLTTPAIVDELASNAWVDNSTRLVVLTVAVETTCSTGGSLVSVMAAFEFLPSGQVAPRWHSTTLLPASSSSSDYYYAPAYSAYFIVFLVLVCVVVVMRWWRRRTTSLLDGLLVLFAALFFAAQSQVQAAYSACSGGGGDFRGLAMQTWLVSNLQGVLVCLLAWRTCTFLHTSPSSSLVLRVLSGSSTVWLACVVVLLVAASAFALTVHFALGRSTANLAVVDLAYASLWISSFFSFGDGVEAMGWGGVVLFVLAYVCLYLVVRALFVGAVVHSYFCVADDVRRVGQGDFSASQRLEQQEEQEPEPPVYQATRRTYGW